MRNSWCGCLRPLRRHRGDGALEDLEQRLLDALARTRRVIDRLSALRAILSTSSM